MRRRSRGGPATAGSVLLHVLCGLIVVSLAARTSPPEPLEPIPRPSIAIVFERSDAPEGEAAAPTAMAEAQAQPSPETEPTPPSAEDTPAPAPETVSESIPEQPPVPPVELETPELPPPPPPEPPPPPLPPPLPPPSRRVDVPSRPVPRRVPPPGPLGPSARVVPPAAATVAGQASDPVSASPAAAPPSAGPSASASPDWRAALSAWLRARTTYPERARRQSLQGRVLVRFTVAKDGEITEPVLVQGSGSAILDEAAIAMLEGARAPAFPAGVSGDRIKITVPITYALRGESR